MDQALSLAGLQDVDVKNLLTFVGLSSKKKSALSVNVVEVIKSITSIVDGLFLEALQQRTSEDFKAVRARVVPIYFVAVEALSHIARRLVSEAILDSIVYESFSELEADFREHGLNKFGAAVRDQALFTVWTMRKINDEVTAISKSPTVLSEESQKKDTEYVSKFGSHTGWAQFHVSFLIHSIRDNKPVFPEVLGDVQDGLRAIVNAYAWVRQGADLRSQVAEPVIDSPEWDEEDTELLASSTHDMEADL